jgi:CheY-like chemotaxis protein
MAEKLVLLVDDEKALLDGMEAWLRDNDSGFAVMSAPDGKKGLELFERYRPDLVVSDVRMPGMSGLELLLSCQRKHPGTRFMLMSAYATEELEQKALSCGAVHFLKKPVDLPHLEKTIVEILGRESSTTPGGFLSGISVPGFVQLLNLERQTLSLRLEQREGSPGTIYFRRGELVHAVYKEQHGEPAVLEMLGWEQVDMLIDRNSTQVPRTVYKPIAHLIMEAMRAKDEEKKARG